MNVCVCVSCICVCMNAYVEYVCVCMFMSACMCGGQMITLADIYQVPHPVGSSNPLFLGHRVGILPSLFCMGSPGHCQLRLTSLTWYFFAPAPASAGGQMYGPQRGLRSQEGTVASQLHMLWDAVGKAPVVHGPSSWSLCEVTCPFSFGSIEVDTLIQGPGGPLRSPRKLQGQIHLGESGHIMGQDGVGQSWMAS